MPIAAKEAAISVESGALCGIADRALAERICREIESAAGFSPVSVAASLAELLECMATFRPRVILLDDDLANGNPLKEFLRQLSEAAPVVLIASFERQREIAPLVAEAKIEFVGREGDFVPLAASLVLRHLRTTKRAPLEFTPAAGPMSDELSEIFRHDINNPLTGILGNAELVLSHSAGFPPADVQRLQTVVELAVRLRETIRQLSDALEAQSGPRRS
ncbi:MAG TPA: histidine kinase dimerization/phospho-acceptor domain-containing protein [Candidatus Acidoferrales bacterium]